MSPGMMFHCLTPEALEALGHRDVPPHELRLVEPPEGVGVRPTSAPPPAGKSAYGNEYADHLNTENFSINWEPRQATAEQAERAGAALEAAWSALVLDQGWTPPVSSDRYLIWVILADDIDGTGFTTEYFTDDYPEGYPVIYMNSTLADYTDFWRSLASHEFHHSLQFALRTWVSGKDSETWYWEASASWASVLVEPETSALDYSVPWYGDQTWVRFDSTRDYHQYGMFVFNAYLDELAAGTMKATWDLASQDQDHTWKEMIGTAAGAPPEELWSAFSGSFGNDLGTRGETWADPPRETLVDGIEGAAHQLGAVYYRAAEDVHVTINVQTGSAGMAGIEDHSATEIDVVAGEVVAVTAFADGTEWTLSVVSAEIEEEDSGDEEEEREREREPEAAAASCACAGVNPDPSLGALIVALAVRRRRRS